MTSALNPADLPDQTPPYWTDTLAPDTIETYGGFAMNAFAELPFAGSGILQYLPDTVQWTPIDNTQTV